MAGHNPHACTLRVIIYFTIHCVCLSCPRVACIWSHVLVSPHSLTCTGQNPRCCQCQLIPGIASSSGSISSTSSSGSISSTSSPGCWRQRLRQLRHTQWMITYIIASFYGVAKFIVQNKLPKVLWLGSRGC